MKIVAFINAYSSGKSGGDIRAIEILKRCPADWNLAVVTSALGRELCETGGLRADFKITTREREFGNVILIYAQRILRGLWLAWSSLGKLEPGTVVYSTSDAWPDVLPALLILLRCRGARWVCPMYHLITSMGGRPGGYSLNNILSYGAQKVSLVLIKLGRALIDTETSFNRDQLVARYGFRPERILVMPSGINTVPIDTARTDTVSDRAVGEPKYDFCYLARIHRSKGVFDLVHAWKKVCDAKPMARLGLAGGGAADVVTELKRLIAGLNLENSIDLLGFLAEEDKYRLLKSSRAYVLPSYEEGIPITFYEAMYSGLPVITYYLPTYCDIKETIIGVPVGDLDRLAAVMLEVINGGLNAKELVSQGRELVRQNNTWEKVADRFWSRLDGR